MEEKTTTIEFRLNPVWHGEDTDVIVDLGYALENGTCFAQDYQSALFLYSTAAKAGNPQAINNIGWLYANGLGVEKDLEHAVSLYEDAASRGNTIAMVNLGNVYEGGLLAGKPDYKKAFFWYREAADLGDKKRDCSTSPTAITGDGAPSKTEKKRSAYFVNCSRTAIPLLHSTWDCTIRRGLPFNAITKRLFAIIGSAHRRIVDTVGISWVRCTLMALALKKIFRQLSHITVVPRTLTMKPPA